MEVAFVAVQAGKLHHMYTLGTICSLLGTRDTVGIGNMFVDHLLSLAALALGYESLRRAMGNDLATAFRDRSRHNLLKNANLRHPDSTQAKHKQMLI
eukprot:6186555-Pleurochrysis_carterae.AAC.2